MARKTLIFITFFFLILSSFVFAQSSSDFDQMISEMGTVMGFLLSLISMPYFILILIIILFVILFKSIIYAGLSNIGFFKNDEKQLRTVSIVLALLMTIGLIGGGGISDGSWSPDNITTNIGRIMRPFGTLSPLLLGFLVGLIVYMSVGKNNPNMTSKKKLGWSFISFALGIYVVATSNVRYAARSEVGWIAFSFVIAFVGILMVLVPEGKGIGDSFFKKIDNLFSGGGGSGERREPSGDSGDREKKEVDKKLKKIDILNNIRALQACLREKKENFSKEYQETLEIFEKINTIQLNLEALNVEDQNFNGFFGNIKTDFEHMKSEIEEKIGQERDQKGNSRKLYRIARRTSKKAKNAAKKCKEIINSNLSDDGLSQELTRLSHILSEIENIFSGNVGFRNILTGLEIDEDKMKALDESIKNHLGKKSDMLGSLATSNNKKNDIKKLRDSLNAIRTDLFKEKNFFDDVGTKIKALDGFVHNLNLWNEEYNNEFIKIEDRMNKINTKIDEKISNLDSSNDLVKLLNNVLSDGEEIYHSIVNIFFADGNDKSEFSKNINDFNLKYRVYSDKYNQFYEKYSDDNSQNNEMKEAVEKIKSKMNGMNQNSVKMNESWNEDYGVRMKNIKTYQMNSALFLDEFINSKLQTFNSDNSSNVQN